MLSIPLWSDFIRRNESKRLDDFLSIPLWSDFIITEDKAKAELRKFFQSHYGLILSYYLPLQRRQSLPFNPTMV